MEIAGNLIAGNTAWGDGHVQFSGGGIWLYGGSYWVHHNTIVFNEARGMSDPSWGGGGIALLKAGPKLIENNIIRCESVATFEIRNNLAWSNVGGDGNGSCADWTSTNGNLAADPRFCDRGVSSGDYSLAADSPALLHPAGPLGAFPIAGCEAAAPQSATWNRIGTLYR
jgi:prepilin-type processing-associated H-X9-DG protein